MLGTSAPSLQHPIPAVLPFKDEGDNEVRVHPDPPITLLSRGVGLGVVGRQDDSGRAADVTPARRWRCTQGERERGRKKDDYTALGLG